MHQKYKCMQCGGELTFHGDYWKCSKCNTQLPALPFYPPPPQPYPGGYYPPYPPQPPNPEVQGLLPTRYDAIFYTGVGVFILLMFAFLFSRGNPIVYALMACSVIIPILAIYWDFKYKVRSTMGTLGNICAICWIIVQILITIALGFIIFSGGVV